MRGLRIAALTPLCLLAGCGGSRTVTVFSRPSTNAPAPAASSSAAATTSRSSPPLASSTVHLATFRSPTGNIGCVIADGQARCDIRNRQWSPPPHPSSCPPVVNYGQGLEVGRGGPGAFVCAGDTALDPTAAPLAYNSSTSVQGFTCTSRTSGMTCTNGGGGGFFISIQSYRVF